MAKEIGRSRRLRKKLYVGEFAIMGFEFTCKVDIDSDTQFEEFLEAFADVAEDKNLLISLDNDDEQFEGFVTSHDRYGSATEEDKAAIEAVLLAHSIVSDVEVSKLVDVFNEK
ncbi:MAG: YggL family protein [Cycloclasticus pugetii]|jgi:uncharacterized protein YggL (DUF469 family)|uniref:DUF469 domain-containing protein n=1 Tax=Cycloclasticus pugetii TaxID=34068 RepID=A0AB33Z2Q2_9GAMM|nr:MULTISPECIES: 50S ribosome-binding protein YggL [Cycloclasticus]ATI03086.1 DUF469 family protein [Cycloclasticus sp. PY97N]EPD13359.1 hypothetical protein L196_04886 [Cycloclasticus pugetii]MDF1830473.1 50S ribosome-binding protein YggL [Cycloclasticus pugetii]PHR48381.1 MAG: DUF469 domain-containing protein [Cycloclasticus sp.]SHJ47779.1 hypothetical protein SAMN05519226_2186 [Cycloclasticus pugetii]|tara:strand:- start:41 stop:379 length:339 start_codon:yes stop_codon:yes gene_type:complete